MGAEIRTVVPKRRRRGRWVALVIGLLLLASLAGAGSVAYAGYNYSERYEGRILPGARIAGVDVSGMKAGEALAAVKAVVRPRLERAIHVRWKKHEWTVTPRALGARSNARQAVERAVAASARKSFLDKTSMRLFDEELGFRRGVAVTHPRDGVRRFVADLASEVNAKPIDTRMDYSTGWIKLSSSKPGYELREKKSRRALYRAFLTGHSHVRFSVRKLRPEVTKKSFEDLLLVHIGENRLYLYEHGKITHSWPVATGQPEYPTPQGVYEITLKRYLPTWINPSPDTWGKSLPAEIPPGPGNPLGLRALNWSAPAIRFHGTDAVYSLGYNASHGCVRMSNDDVIELYNLVDVGTPIVSLQYGDLRPLYTSTSVVDQATAR
jgi:lipoprotein-anchoring transpeptidase ErfK/SrfK